MWLWLAIEDYSAELLAASVKMSAENWSRRFYRRDVWRCRTAGVTEQLRGGSRGGGEEASGRQECSASAFSRLLSPTPEIHLCPSQSAELPRIHDLLTGTIVSKATFSFWLAFRALSRNCHTSIRRLVRHGTPRTSFVPRTPPRTLRACSWLPSKPCLLFVFFGQTP